jgi:hypothetical protein
MLIKAIVTKYAPYGIWMFFFFFCFRYAVQIFNGGNSWKTGDWLINYSVGPIRRGLVGTVLLTVSDFGLPLLWLTYIFQVSIYASILIIVLKLYKQSERGLFWLLILYSPAFLLFPFYDFGGGFRKEIIVLGIFAFFCLLYAKKKITQIKLTFVCAIYVLAGLSHEATVLTLPFFLYLLHISTKEALIKYKTAIIYSVIFTIASVIILFFAFLHKGDIGVKNAMCQSLIDRKLNYEICSGAIASLEESVIYSMNNVLKGLSYMSLYTPVLFALAILPLFFTTWWTKKTYVLFIISSIAISPLFLISMDWGRWIYILTFMLFCLALAEKVMIKFAYKRMFVIAGVIYLTTWSIPHCCVGGSGFGGGIFGVIKKIIEKLNM